ncbi:MAG: hypothetical protein ACKO15_10685 [Burkholderiales bacterium]
MVTDEDSQDAHHMGDLLTAGMNRYDAAFDLATRNNLAGKFGFIEWREEDSALVNDAYRLMVDAEVDMTIFFRLWTDSVHSRSP